jgi:hypothetical protein
MIVEWNGGGPEMDGIFEEWKEEKKAKNKSFMEMECSIYISSSSCSFCIDLPFYFSAIFIFYSLINLCQNCFSALDWALRCH